MPTDNPGWARRSSQSSENQGEQGDRKGEQRLSRKTTKALEDADYPRDAREMYASELWREWTGHDRQFTDLVA